MALFTYLIAFGHFGSEWLIFRSVKVGPGLLSPVLVSCMSSGEFVKHTSKYISTAASMIWMLNQYDFYIKY